MAAGDQGIGTGGRGPGNGEWGLGTRGGAGDQRYGGCGRGAGEMSGWMKRYSEGTL